jgi:hypothetical protein
MVRDGIRILILGMMPTVACLPLASPRRRTHQRGHRGHARLPSVRMGRMGRMGRSAAQQQIGAMGEEVLPGEFSQSLGCGVWPAPYRVRAKKSSGPAAAPADIAGAAAGVRSNTFMILPFLTDKAFRRPQEGSLSGGWSRTAEACGGHLHGLPDRPVRLGGCA